MKILNSNRQFVSPYCLYQQLELGPQCLNGVYKNYPAKVCFCDRSMCNNHNENSAGLLVDNLPFIFLCNILLFSLS